MADEVVRTYDITVEIKPEGGLYLAFCPDFDISSFGETEGEAVEMIRDAVKAFLLSAPQEEADRRYKTYRRRHGKVLTERVQVSALA